MVFLCLGQGVLNRLIKGVGMGRGSEWYVHARFIIFLEAFFIV